jgi:hypothetical protein
MQPAAENPHFRHTWTSRELPAILLHAVRAPQ